MKSEKKFRNKPESFWAIVKLMSQELGYTSKKEIKTYSIKEIEKFINERNFKINDNFNKKDIERYFKYRAEVLNNIVQNSLMDAKEARKLFKKLKKKHKPTCPIPLNKQKGKKKAEAYFTGSINILIQSCLKKHKIGECDYDPKTLLVFSDNNKLKFVSSRRIDGCFPSARNPIAVWEIKEYYYTTTFGSRVADGVYETMLDGYEFDIARSEIRKKIDHILFIDAKYTWWDLGKSYLCRLVDIINKGLVTEVVFGKEIIEKIPLLVNSWIRKI